MTELPEPGSTVAWGRSRYTVVRHGCATNMPTCVNGDLAVTVLAPGKPVGWALCVSFDKLQAVAEE